MGRQEEAVIQAFVSTFQRPFTLVHPALAGLSEAYQGALDCSY